MQSNEILLNLSLKCWNSAFNAQGSRVNVVVVPVGAVKIYVTEVEAIGKKERAGETQFTRQTRVPVLYFCKIPRSSFDAMMSKLAILAPPNSLTLWITLISASFPNVQKDQSIMFIHMWSQVQNPSQILFFQKEY